MGWGLTLVQHGGNMSKGRGRGKGGAGVGWDDVGGQEECSRDEVKGKMRVKQELNQMAKI
jgi:hypothetical protein